MKATYFRIFSYTHTWSKPATCLRVLSSFFMSTKLSCLGLPIFVQTRKMALLQWNANQTYIQCTNCVHHKIAVNYLHCCHHELNYKQELSSRRTGLGYAGFTTNLLVCWFLSQFSSDQIKSLLLSVRGVGWEKLFLLRSIQPFLPTYYKWWYACLSGFAFWG